MQKSSRSENQVLMLHGFSILGKWIKSSLEHGLFPFPVTRDSSARGELPRRSPQVYSMRGLRIYPLLAHCIGRYSGKVEAGVVCRGRAALNEAALRSRRRGE